VVNQRSEACDDGNRSNTDGCTNNCSLPACGDGFVQAGETCDDGNKVNGDGCNASCGNEPPGGGTPPPPPGVTGGAAPVIIPVTGEPHAIAAGIGHTCALTPEGGVQCWGNNDFGQLGDGTNNSSNVPVDVVGFGLASTGSDTAQVLKAAAKPVFASAASTIVAGGNHTCVISGSEVWCWGQNDQGQLGDGSTENRNKPVKVLSGAADITAGLSYTCAELFNGQVMCWGDNSLGQLADGSTTDHNSPTVASLVTGLANVDAGQNKDCGITHSGLVRCVTSNADNFVNEHPGPNLDVAVSRFNNLILALTNDGVPVEFKSGKPEIVESLTSVEDVDSGVGHVCALKSDGTVFCWGSNNYGQLGNDSTTSSTNPDEVVDLSGAYQLAVGKNHVCVLIPNSTPGLEDRIMCWGLNTDGQLGDASNDNSNVPVEVAQE
jgi:cysteine-rich repeat protein